MANSIDWGTLALGAVIGVGCQDQLKSAAKITAGLAANLALTAAQAVDDVASEVNRQANGQKAAGQPQANGQNGNGV